MICLLVTFSIILGAASIAAQLAKPKPTHKCLRCGRTFDREVCYHLPAEGVEPIINRSRDVGCFGKVVKI